MLIFFSFPGAIIGTFFVGFIYDILGRRWTLFLSFITGAGLLAAIPWTSPNVLPGLLLVRILIQLTFCAPASSPLSADYIHKESLGIGSALTAIGLVIGEVISMGILFRVTNDMSAYWAFALVAVIGSLLAFFLLFIITEPQLRKTGIQIAKEAVEK